MPKKKSTKKVWIDEDGDGVADAHGDIIEETPVAKKKVVKKASKADLAAAAEKERRRRRLMGF